MDNENKKKKMKTHKRIYIFLLILAIISFIDVISRSFVKGIFQNFDADVGIFGLLIISITRNPVIIGISAVLLDFGLFLLIVALLERQTYKKIEKELKTLAIKETSKQ